MGTLLTLLLTFLSTTAISYFFLFRLTFRALGSNLRRRTGAKRELVLSKLASDDDGGGGGGEGGGKKVSGVVVGFFHPFCNAGGGGERVLWAAIRATQSRFRNVMCVVYTGDHEADKGTILERVENRFDIHLDPSRILFLYLSTRHYVSASTWPHFTLLGQSLGSLVLAWDAFTLLVPDIFIDTMGYGFTLPFAKLLFDIPTAAYVHYPTISTDMLCSLPTDDATLRTKAKKIYWRLFAMLYSWCGGYVDIVMANSSWTAGHMRSLWGEGDKIEVVFPPVAVEALEEAIPLSINGLGMKREKIILCIAQFRPEKKHDLIIEAFSQLIHPPPSTTTTSSSSPPLPNPHANTKLVLLGSVRHSEDATRVYDLRLLAHEKLVKDQVQFVCDSSWGEILEWLAKSWVGVNGMWNEHFGIGCVEYMAAGLVGVVHDSGGPKMDIVVEFDGGRTGYHAKTASEFAAAFREALSLPQEEIAAMRLRARASAMRFTEKVFAEKWVSVMEKLLERERRGRREVG